MRSISILAATAATVLCILIPTPAPADFIGAGSAEHHVAGQKWADLTWTGDSVASVKENAVTYERLNRPIVLRGRIVTQLGPDRYQFEDDSGSIRIDADPKVFPQQPIDDKTLVDIIGNVDMMFVTELEIDVDTIRIISLQ